MYIYFIYTCTDMLKIWSIQHAMHVNPFLNFLFAGPFVVLSIDPLQPIQLYIPILSHSCLNRYDNEDNLK